MNTRDAAESAYIAWKAWKNEPDEVSAHVLDVAMELLGRKLIGEPREQQVSRLLPTCGCDVETCFDGKGIMHTRHIVRSQCTLPAGHVGPHAA